MSRWRRGSSDPDLDEYRAMDHASSSTVPATIIHGRHDRVVPLTNAEFLAVRLPTSRLVIIEAGHFVWRRSRSSTPAPSSTRSPAAGHEA